MDHFCIEKFLQFPPHFNKIFQEHAHISIFFQLPASFRMSCCAIMGMTSMMTLELTDKLCSMRASLDLSIFNVSSRLKISRLWSSFSSAYFWEESFHFLCCSFSSSIRTCNSLKTIGINFHPRAASRGFFLDFMLP